jgi:hypothetical protein
LFAAIRANITTFNSSSTEEREKAALNVSKRFTKFQDVDYSLMFKLYLAQKRLETLDRTSPEAQNIISYIAAKQGTIFHEARFDVYYNPLNIKLMDPVEARTTLLILTQPLHFDKATRVVLEKVEVALMLLRQRFKEDRNAVYTKVFPLGPYRVDDPAVEQTLDAAIGVAQRISEREALLRSMSTQQREEFLRNEALAQTAAQGEGPAPPVVSLRPPPAPRQPQPAPAASTQPEPAPRPRPSFLEGIAARGQRTTAPAPAEAAPSAPAPPRPPAPAGLFAAIAARRAAQEQTQTP